MLPADPPGHGRPNPCAAGPGTPTPPENTLMNRGRTLRLCLLSLAGLGALVLVVVSMTPGCSRKPIGKAKDTGILEHSLEGVQAKFREGNLLQANRDAL